MYVFVVKKGFRSFGLFLIFCLFVFTISDVNYAMLAFAIIIGIIIIIVKKQKQDQN